MFLRSVTLFVGVILLAAPVGPGVARAQSGEISREVKSILAAALGPSRLEENLRRLTDEIGGRRSTSPEMQRAANWAVVAFQQAGVDKVEKEPFYMMSSWAPGETALEVLEPQTSPLRVAPLGWSPNTPSKGLEALVFDVGEGTADDFARLGSRAEGALLLVHTPVLHTWEDLFAEYGIVAQAQPRAYAAGAAGILWMSSRMQKQLYRRAVGWDGEIGPIPEVLVAREDALRISRLLAAGHDVQARLTMRNTIGGIVDEHNVVAEVRGTGKPEEIVIIGAHLDSWAMGTGALDNGANAALVIDVARALSAAGRRPRRTVRFILFSGEEQGMLGSMEYVRAHQEELDNIVAAIIFDEGLGRVTGYTLGGRPELEAAVREVLRPVESWGSNQHTTDAILGTDNFDFLLEGIPNLVANQVEANYIENYHAGSDTFDKVDIRELKLHAAYAAVTVWGIADRRDRIGKRLSRPEVEALLKRTGLEAGMKGLGLWEMWETLQRGRQP